MKPFETVDETIRGMTTDSKVKVPLLGDLPVLGYLFRSTVRQKGQTELMVSSRPTSCGTRTTPVDYAAIRRATSPKARRTI